ncbi:MAG: UDP-3-O-(3-hydroxymyristoyl)glucosamine N-acyltransferase [Rhizobiales bacterium]|nr:UDP-3-O-(3-hydroxymyristoyl)glucosamine N-acyltransferase [Hyphomicrobiales bacterium]MBO6698160.1 UDP-3-O-(3-hydroxymyristoyl)glucosamine N-acyltransferase [Hyphomicrobiales bacterium]MBO6735586.1 UDP-3-O-(3-hydroxymyristoyl)glucosamine N-acyltransferase [Hyphomicrobiales bacterium]MBO6910606.1 UDP-3-O-(3-hydroxymyristoyl)glucosamine N-acyltransferase [Hyphomicrobiales bacterium]
MTSPAFFPPLVPHSAESLAKALGLELVGGDVGSSGRELVGVAPIEQADKGTLSFLDNAKYAGHLETTDASCVILADRFKDRLKPGVVGLVSKEPYRDFARAAALMVPSGVKLQGTVLSEGISPAAHIDPSATLEEGVTIESGAVIGAHAAVGAGTTVCAGAVIAHHVQIGRDGYVGAQAVVQHALIGDRVILHSGVNIGQDGFGFAMSPMGHLKVPQLGRVIIQDDVEIGAGSCIDRGTTRDTIIGEGTKIDNLVQIGHNVEIGRHCVLVGQVGIAGSSVLEDFVAIGGHSGVAGHLRIGMGAQIAAASNVKDDVPPGARWAGTPAKSARTVFRELAAIKRLGEQGTKPMD